MHRVLRSGAELALRPKAFELLVYLAQNRDRVVSKEELFAALWPQTTVSDNSLAQCVIDLRRAIGDDVHDPRYIRTVPRVGYQFVAPVEAAFAAQAETVEISHETTFEVEYQEEHTADPVTRWRSAIVISLLAVALAGAGWMLWRRTQPRAEAPIAARSIAVLFFENQSRTVELDWLREGLQDMLSTRLAQTPGISVLSHYQVAALSKRLAATSNSPEQAWALTRDHGAQLLITGRFARLGGQIRVAVDLYGVAGRRIASESFVIARSEDLLAAADLLGLKLLARAGLRAGPHEAGLGAVLTNSVEAYRYYSQAVVLARAYHNREAVRLLEKAIALDPGFAMAQARVGYIYAVTWIYAGKGKPYLERAFASPDRLTPRDRLHVAAWYAIASLDWPGAIRAYRELLAAFPAEVEAHHRLAHLLAGEERMEEALAVIGQGIAVDPSAADLYNLEAGLCAQLGRHEQAIAAATRYVALSPGEANAYDTLGMAYAAAGRAEEARQAYLRALDADPGFDPAIIHLGGLEFRQGRYREAGRLYQRYLDSAPSELERARAHGAFFTLYRRLGDKARATAHARVNEAVPSLPSTYSDHILTLLWQGRTEQARKLIRRRDEGQELFSSRGRRPPLRPSSMVWGREALVQGQAEAALQHFREALRHPPNLFDPDSGEDCLAAALLQSGRYDEAIAEYERVLRVVSGDGWTQFHLAEAWRRKGNHDMARAAFERFLELWRGADADVPQLGMARRYLTTGEAPAGLPAML